MCTMRRGGRALSRRARFEFADLMFVVVAVAVVAFRAAAPSTLGASAAAPQCFVNSREELLHRDRKHAARCCCLSDSCPEHPDCPGGDVLRAARLYAALHGGGDRLSPPLQDSMQPTMTVRVRVRDKTLQWNTLFCQARS